MSAPTARGRRRESSRHRVASGRRIPGRLAWLLRGGAPLLSLVPAALALVLVQSITPAAQAIPAGPARFELAGARLLAEPGALIGYDLWVAAPPFGRLQLGLLLRLLQAGGAQSWLAAAHGAMLLLALAQLVLLWFVLRRSGASGLAAGAGAAVFGVAPIAVAVHTVVATASIAVLWLLVAAVLAVGRRSRVALAAAGGAASLAVATAPVSVLVVVALVAVVVRAAGPRTLVPAAVGAAGVALGVAITAAALAGATTSAAAGAAMRVAAPGASPPVVGTAALERWLVVDPLSLLLVAVALVLVAPTTALRPVVGLAALIALAASWPLGADAVVPILLLLPVGALAIAVVVDRAVVLLGDPAYVRSVIGSGWLMGVAALLVVAAVVWIASLGDLVRSEEQSAARTERWIREAVPPGSTVLVDLGLWPDLAGDRGVEWYAAGTGARAVPTSVPWSAADYVVATRALRAEPARATRRAVERATTVAAFGTGPAALQVRARLEGAAPTPSASPRTTPTTRPTPSSDAERRAEQERREVGAQLTRNDRVVVSSEGRAALLDGQVDSRIAIVLATFATTDPIVVGAFETVPGDESGIRRRVVISAVDGRPVPGDAQRTAVLLRFLAGLEGDWSVTELDAGPQGVSAVFAPLGP